MNLSTKIHHEENARRNSTNQWNNIDTDSSQNKFGARLQNISDVNWVTRSETTTILYLYCTLYPRNKSKLSCVNLKIISPLKIKFFDSKIIMLNPPNYIRNGNYIKLNKYYIITYHRMTNETHVFLYTIISDIFWDIPCTRPMNG